MVLCPYDDDGVYTGPRTKQWTWRFLNASNIFVPISRIRKCNSDSLSEKGKKKWRNGMLCGWKEGEKNNSTTQSKVRRGRAGGGFWPSPEVECFAAVRSIRERGKGTKTIALENIREKIVSCCLKVRHALIQSSHLDNAAFYLRFIN